MLKITTPFEVLSLTTTIHFTTTAHKLDKTHGRKIPFIFLSVASSRVRAHKIMQTKRGAPNANPSNGEF